MHSDGSIVVRDWTIDCDNTAASDDGNEIAFEEGAL